MRRVDSGGLARGACDNNLFGPLRGAALAHMRGAALAHMRLSEGMDTQFFDRQSLCIGRVWEGVCEYQHTFGGPARHDGASLPALGQPAHLLYLFDLGDLRLGLAIPGLRRLPIYYAFGIEYGPFCYRVLAD